MSRKQKQEGLLPRSNLKLDTLSAVRSEMARLYRLTLKKEIETDTFTKLIYGLKEIRGCIEASLLEDVQDRLSELSARVEARRG